MFQNSERRTTWIVLFLLVAAAVVSLSTSYIAHSQSNSVDYWSWLDGAAQNFSTEMMGAIVTFGLFELILGSQKAKRQKAEQIEELQKQLVREVGSQSNETAKATVDRLRAEGWLTTEDSIALLKKSNLKNAKLQGAYLVNANLEQVILRDANLQEADLRYVNLVGADLWKANLQQTKLKLANLKQVKSEEINLQKADLWRVNLQQAELMWANLQEAQLHYTDLQKANLWRANLQSVNFYEANLEQSNLQTANLQKASLWMANLQGANLMGVNLRSVVEIEAAMFDEKTVLPDAQPIEDESGNNLVDENGTNIYDKYWTPQTDMRRYTDPQHPDFWEPDYLKSGYEGDKPWWVEKQAED
jgi:uncharacterized protein YjbI with pentapeptide repeats